MPPDPLEVWAFGPQFHRVPAYSQASALLLQKLMKTLSLTSSQNVTEIFVIATLTYVCYHSLYFQ